MIPALQVLAVVLVAIAMALALAHALELPGKMRLAKEQYLAVQPIYYPGFTIGGAAEPAAMFVLVALLIAMPAEGAAFWLVAAALLALIAMHAAYWLLTHPVNNFWLKDFKPQGLGGGFFAFDPLGRRGGEEGDWTALRDRWELSHVVRAGFGLASLIFLAVAVAA